MSNYITKKDILQSFIQYTKEQLFQNKNQPQEPNALVEYILLLQPPQKLGSCANLCYCDFANIALKTHVQQQADCRAASLPLPPLF